MFDVEVVGRSVLLATGKKRPERMKEELIEMKTSSIPQQLQIRIGGKIK